ncbi:phosphatase PAP2 family protein [Kitasatospora sp. NPDC004240]
MAPAVLAVYDGSGVSGGLYTRVVGWAAASPHWLDQMVRYWSAFGLLLFALLMVAGWWRARGAPSAVMARVLASPPVVLAAFAVNSGLKSLVEEGRPCARLLAGATLEACPGPGDWSFPSNHSVAAAAAATALLVADRRLGRVAVPAAAAMALSRVWVGVHYPHDVLVGALVGVLVAAPLALLAARAAPLVDRARAGVLGPWFGRGVRPLCGRDGRWSM